MKSKFVHISDVLNKFTMPIANDYDLLVGSIVNLFDNCPGQAIVVGDILPVWRDTYVLRSVMRLVNTGRKLDLIMPNEEIVGGLQSILCTLGVRNHMLDRDIFYNCLIPPEDILGWDKNYISTVVSTKTHALYLLPIDLRKKLIEYYGVVVNDAVATHKLFDWALNALECAKQNKQIRLDAEHILNVELANSNAAILNKMGRKAYLINSGVVIGAFDSVDEADKYVLNKPELLVSERCTLNIDE